MAGLASFLKGASRYVKKEMDDELAIQRELELMEAKQRMLEEIQRRNEKIAQGIDPNTGEMYTIYGDGREQRNKLPQAAVDQYRAEQEALLQKRRLDQEKAEADIESKRSTSSRNRSMEEVARERLGIERQRANSDSQRNAAMAQYYRAGGSKGAAADPAAKMEKDADALFKAITSDDTISPSKAQAAQRIRFSSLTPEQKLQALLELSEAED